MVVEGLLLTLYVLPVVGVFIVLVVIASILERVAKAMERLL